MSPTDNVSEAAGPLSRRSKYLLGVAGAVAALECSGQQKLGLEDSQLQHGATAIKQSKKGLLLTSPAPARCCAPAESSDARHPHPLHSASHKAGPRSRLTWAGVAPLHETGRASPATPHHAQGVPEQLVS